MSKTDKQIIKRILLHCNEVIKAHEHFCDSQDLFMDEENGGIYRNSITMPILQIGELSKLLSDDIKQKYSNVPWRETIRIRDFLAHHYWRLDYGIMWNTSHESIIQLKNAISVIIDDLL